MPTKKTLKKDQLASLVAIGCVAVWASNSLAQLPRFDRASFLQDSVVEGVYASQRTDLAAANPEETGVSASVSSDSSSLRTSGARPNRDRTLSPDTTGRVSTVREVATDTLLSQASQPHGDAVIPAPAPFTPQDGLIPPVSELGVAPLPQGEYIDPNWGGSTMPYPYTAGNSVGCPQGWQGSCPNARYAQAELFYMSRWNNRSHTLSDAFFVPDSDYELAIRGSIGQRFDCSDGWEISYVGPFKWTSFAEVRGVSFNPLFVPSGVNVSAFTDAVYHAQSYESKLNSFELLRKYWAWDVMSQSFGIRYLNIEEEYRFFSANGLGETGQFEIDVRNHLLGLQYGIDILYPYGPRWVFATKGKLGLYGNLAEGEAQLVNAGLVQFEGEADKGQLAFLGEFGLYATYRILPRVSARAGYEFWYLYGCALSSEQETPILTRYTGRSLSTDSDTFYHGATAGIEVVW